MRQKEKVDQIIKKLDDGIRNLRDSDAYKDYLRVMGRFHNYSYQNCVLIAMQRPGASHVAGYRSWETNFGRHVKRGEKGITILAPCQKKTEKTEMNDATGEAESNVVTYTYFKTATVFDISQTEGKELPRIGAEELMGDAKHFEILKRAVETAADVPIVFEDIKGGAKGYFSRAEGKIAVQSGMSQSQTIKTMIHELSHSRLHTEGKEEKDRFTKEVEAESVAFSVCDYFGIDTGDYSFAYISGWSSGDLQEFKGSLKTIRDEAHAIIESITGYIKERTKEKTRSIKEQLKSGQERCKGMEKVCRREDNDRIKSAYSQR